MATALFIKRADLVKNTALNGSVDTDKFIQFIHIAQEIHVRNFMGTDLYDKISSDIIGGSLSGDYLELINDYIQPMLIHYAMAEYLPFAAYTIANGGVYKHNSENSTIASKEEVDLLINRERDYAEYYTQRFIDYMSFHADEKFPEYYTNNNEDIYPDKDVLFHGWSL
jgi:hypothetical protein|tara:strand:+ start:212 stop:715 length:504 start_codon:yes stop_codon:yes gene_type:complete